MKTVKRWDWLVPVLVFSLLVPACPQQAAQSAAEAACPPRYESKIYPGEPVEEPVESQKGSITYLDRTHYRVSVGADLLAIGSDPIGQGSYTLINGRYLEPDTTWYVEPWAVLARNERAVKDVRIIEFTRTMWQRDGVWPYLRVSEPDVFEGTIRYKDDRPDRPRVVANHNGDGVLARFFGALRRIGHILINGWLLRETLQSLGCFAFNHTIGLAGVGAVPAWCVNPPGFKEGDPGTGFDQRLVYELEEEELEEIKSSLEQYRGWLELPLEKYQVVKYQWAVTYVVKHKNRPAEARHISGIIAMDTDGDGIPDDWEIDHGTNPDDPNDPGNEPELVTVPNLVGRTVPEAETIVEPLALNLHPVIFSFSSTVPAGRIISQSPVSGVQVAPGSDVAIVVSAGPAPGGEVEIPCFINPMTNEPFFDSEMSSRLGAGGFSFIRHVVYCPDDPDCGDTNGWLNADCWQTYRWSWECGDTADPETATLHYWVRGCLPCFVIGSDAEEVISQFEAAGFLVAVAEEYHPTIPAGGLISYSPGCQEVAEDCTAQVLISQGPQSPNPLSAEITAPANNFVGTVGQAISFTSTVAGGTPPYTFKWHFPDNSFRYQQNVTKTFDIPGAGWVYLDVTDNIGTMVRDQVWVQIN